MSTTAARIAASVAVVVATAVPLARSTHATATSACASFTFDSGTEGWRSWWSGAVATSGSARTGAGSLRSVGGPPTAAVDLGQELCALPIRSVSMHVRLSNAASLFVKTIDQVTGAARLVGPLRIGTDWSAVSVPVDLTHPVTLGVEASGAGELFLDDVLLETDETVPTTTTQTTTVRAALCTSEFERDIEGWRPMSAGAVTQTGVARTGAGALAAYGGPTVTARRDVAPECGQGTLRMFARAYGGSRSVYINQLATNGALTQAGPFAVSDAWTEIAATARPGTATVQIEGYGSGDLLIDDFAMGGSANVPVTSPPSAPTTTTLPAPPSSGPTRPDTTCAFDFEPDSQGWTSWWSGSVARTTGRSGAGLYVLGAPGTTQRSVAPIACGAQGVRLWMRSDGGSQRVFVKVVDSKGTVTALVGPLAVGVAWTSIDASLPSEDAATVAVESYGTSSAGLIVDDVSLLSTISPTITAPTTAPATTPPTTPPATTPATTPTTTSPVPTSPVTTPATTPPATTPAPTPAGGGVRCVALLHGLGGSGSNPVLIDGTWLLQPAGNWQTPNGLAWDYLSDARTRQNLATITAEVNSVGCAQVVLVGFSNGGGMAASIFCRGESFGGRLRGVILDDAVLDSVPVSCAPPAAVGVSMLYTDWMAGIGALGGPCDPGWICLGNRQSLSVYASQVGASPTRKSGGHEVEPDHIRRAAAFWR